MKIGKGLRRAVLPLAAIATLGGAVSCDDSTLQNIRDRFQRGSVTSTYHSKIDSLQDIINRQGDLIANYTFQKDGIIDSLNLEIEERDAIIADYVETKAEETPVAPAPVVAPAAKVETAWRYNGNYELLEDDEKDGRLDYFRVQPGNTIAGGIHALAKSNNARLSNKEALGLSSQVEVYRKGKQVNVRPEQIRPGDLVYFNNAVQDAVYGRSRATTPEIVSLDKLTTADLNSDGVIDPRDFGIFLERYANDEYAKRLSPITNTDGTEPNVFDFYALVDHLNERVKLSIEVPHFLEGYNAWKRGDFRPIEIPAEADTIESSRRLRNAITLSPMFSSHGPGIFASYDRLLGNSPVGIGAAGGYNGEDPFWTGRVTLGNDRARAGLGLGLTHTDYKKAVTLEVPLQYSLGNDDYVELTPGIRDFGRWKDQVDGNGFEGTKEYGQVRAGVGFRF